MIKEMSSPRTLFPTNLPVLFSERCCLTPIESAHQQPLFALHKHNVVNDFLPYETWLDASQASEFVQQVQQYHESKAAIHLAVIHQKFDQLIGRLVVFNLDDKHRSVEIGYAFHPDFWGEGLAKESCCRLIDYLLKERGVHRINAIVDTENVASIALLRRCGFVHEGTMRECRQKQRRWIDSAIFGLLSNDFNNGST
ncbi:GNAT family protein [uncultured Umboniibacter sp.]|uniref:GNAT family N-acetyltransferase n=1 Tax=uncultured Umboniibacter sp. TaxID=1798917 RepID=UPI00263914A3|nr:GNAT family protein [uncultured Umboniibacter sp.]